MKNNNSLKLIRYSFPCIIEEKAQGKLRVFESDDLPFQVKRVFSVVNAKVFAKKVSDPERFGVVRFDENMRANKIIEKPKKWISDYALTGLYVFDKRVAEVAKNVKPSKRGEIEIVDLHNWYLDREELDVAMVDGSWLDAGTFDSLLEAQVLAKEKLQDKMVI